MNPTLKLKRRTNVNGWLVLIIVVMTIAIVLNGLEIFHLKRDLNNERIAYDTLVQTIDSTNKQIAAKIIEVETKSDVKSETLAKAFLQHNEALEVLWSDYERRKKSSF